MKPSIETQRLNAFVDGELDLASQLDMEERLRVDAGLREKVEGLRQLRAAIREGADYHAAPAEWRQRMTTLVAPKPAPSIRPSDVAAAVHRWLGWRPMAASLALVAVMAVALNLALLRSSQDERLLDEVVASHVRSTIGEHLVDVASSDRHTVKPWLSSKLDFSPPVNELQIPGSVFLGGRIDYLDGRPVAALVYRQGRHIVNAFVWPGGAKDSKADFSAERGFQTAHWAQGGMNHWVISDLGREEFKAVVRAVQAAGSDR
jgi:anti-sigma factor RsiW